MGFGDERGEAFDDFVGVEAEVACAVVPGVLSLSV